MWKGKRTGNIPVPNDLEEKLNEAQLFMLKKMEGLGWELKFLRRPMHQDIAPVLLHRQSNQSGILEDDGTFKMQPDIKIRETDRSVNIACPNCGYMVYGRAWRCPKCGG